MDNVLNILPGGSWQILLLSTLLLSTIASLLGMMALVLVRQPAGRSWVLLIALTACVVLPATHGTVRLAGWGISIPVSVATQRNQTESSEAVVGSSRVDVNSENSIVRDQFIESSSHDLSATVALLPKRETQVQCQRTQRSPNPLEMLQLPAPFLHQRLSNSSSMQRGLFG